MYSDLWMNVDIYGGIVLFTGIITYDMYIAEKLYREGNHDHLGCSTKLYLDFINILIRIITIIAKAKQNSK